MNSISLPKDFKDPTLEEELKRFNLLEVLRLELTLSDILLLNEILCNYTSYTDIQTAQGIYKIFNYDSFFRRYEKYFEPKNFVYKSKDRLEKKGLIKTVKGNFSCPILGYCKIGLVLNNRTINKILL